MILTADEILTFQILFWVFFVASMIGVLLEGIFCLVSEGHWETHVLTVWGPFNFLYGLGAILFFTCAATITVTPLPFKILLMTIPAVLMELAGGLILKYCLGMRAWDYSDQFLNLDGIICLAFSLGWAIPATLVCLNYQKVTGLIAGFRTPAVDKTAVVLCILLTIDAFLAAVCITRWSKRHYHTAKDTKIGALIDRLADDEWMSRRFIEWKFIR